MMPQPDPLPPRRVSIVVISKNEPSLALTLEHLERQLAADLPSLVSTVEIVVVDASSEPPVAIQAKHPGVRFVPFIAPEHVRVSIPHQRNRGVQEAEGDVIVFTDCGCVPEQGWLEALLEPILVRSERITCGQIGATGHLDPYRRGREQQAGKRYLKECPTGNLALERSVFDEIGGFDESFEYGSDVDFSWRAIHHGLRIRFVPDAVVLHDWGSRRRQLKRSFVYGKARARLYVKHFLSNNAQSVRRRRLDERDAVPLTYPLFLLGLPLALRYPSYLLLLSIPLWRSRRERPLETLIDHLVLGAGVLAGFAELAHDRRR
jgi:glycosyltransferase involved in cell wall biosynthesis